MNAKLGFETHLKLDLDAMPEAPTLVGLRAARELIATGWIQGTLARDQRGGSVDPTSVTAVSWCAVGALDALAGRGVVGVLGVWDALRLQCPAPIYDWQDSLVTYNDTPGRTQEEVLAVFDRAIAEVPSQ